MLWLTRWSPGRLIHMQKHLKSILWYQATIYTSTLKTRRSRDLCRSILGPDVVFIVLNLTKSCIKKRLAGRHGEGENAERFSEVGQKMYDLYEPAGEDEDGAHNITITEDMSTDDVANLILEKIGKI